MICGTAGDAIVSRRHPELLMEQLCLRHRARECLGHRFPQTPVLAPQAIHVGFEPPERLGQLCDEIACVAAMVEDLLFTLAVATAERLACSVATEGAVGRRRLGQQDAMDTGEVVRGLVPLRLRWGHGPRAWRRHGHRSRRHPFCTRTPCRVDLNHRPVHGALGIGRWWRRRYHDPRSTWCHGETWRWRQHHFGRNGGPSCRNRACWCHDMDRPASVAMLHVHLTRQGSSQRRGLVRDTVVVDRGWSHRRWRCH
mmetsp:Transcript_73345/g.203538  ORF Transcript_73345/g.203538 Transcript_73345/m.203538 type:complete len:254 (-) Transcript_73345:674-1435(-)